MATNQEVGFADLTGIDSLGVELEKSLEILIQGIDATAGNEPSTADLLKMQQKMQQWSLVIDLQATVAKMLSDTMKGIVQKSG